MNMRAVPHPLSAVTCEPPRSQVRVVVLGHVDHGKSTLIGRLIHDTGSLAEGKLEAVQAMSARRGMPFEWAFLLDALQAERDQGITIDTSQAAFRTRLREVILIDAPGHVEFLQNMVTGAAQADMALLVIDAAEGVQEQSRRHGLLLKLLGLRQVAVVVNKMDKAGYGEAAFDRVKTEFAAYLSNLDVEVLAFIPVTARGGDMVVARGENMGWYTGPTVVQLIDNVQIAVPPRALPLRFIVQDIYKFDDRRIVAGRVESGVLRQGDDIVFLPSGKQARVRSIETWPQAQEVQPIGELPAGAHAGITLDRDIFVERGEVAAPRLARPNVGRAFSARIFWLGQVALHAGARLTLRLGTAEVAAKVEGIAAVVDSDSLQLTTTAAVQQNQIADIELSLAREIVLDDPAIVPQLGRFVLEVDGRISGGGIVLPRNGHQHRPASPNVTIVESAVSDAERLARHGHRGAVVWLTGLPSSGKSTIGRAVERILFDRGARAILLDGDTLRTGLNGDLGFSTEDRTENIRRTAEVASFLASHGQIAIVALVSPDAADRTRARAIGAGAFLEVHVQASVETCAARDPKGLYARARAGEIRGLTGVSAPYDIPENPELVLDTDCLSLDECAAQLMRCLERGAVVETRLGDQSVI